MVSDIAQQILTALTQMSGWELAAVVLGIAYLLLAMRENILCWYAGFVSTLILTFLFWDASLLMDSALQVYYLGMAVYGWYQWRYHPGSNQDHLPISTWGPSLHLLVITAVFGLSWLSGTWLASNTEAAWPYLDSFTTWGSVVTTYMVAKKVLENWIYWIVIDALSVFLYLDRGLFLTAGMYLLYTLIAMAGFWQWLQHYQREQRLCTA